MFDPGYNLLREKQAAKRSIELDILDDDEMTDQHLDKTSLTDEIAHEVGDQYLDNEMINTNFWQHGEGRVASQINNYTPNQD